MNLTQEQKEQLGIVDERVDFYFKVENTVIDGLKKINEDGEEITEMPFEDIYEAHLFVVLSRYCNNGQVAYPSLNTLCEKCYCSKPTLLKAIKGLEKKGYIAKINRQNSETKTNQTNVYSVKNISIPVAKDSVGGSKGDLLGVVKEIYHPSKAGLHKEELLKNNKLKRTTTTTKEQKNSSSSVPNLIKYLEEKKVNKTTIKNILKLDVTLERVEEVMNYCSENKLGIGMVVNLLKDKSELKPIISTEEKKLTAKEKANYIKTILSDEKLEELMEEAKQVLITTGISLSENKTLLTEYESLLVQEYNKKIKKQCGN